MDACPDFIGVVKIFALTRVVHVPRPKGQLGSCPILLSCRIALELESHYSGKHFSKVSIRGIERQEIVDNEL
jgi:hypothetical protein